MFGIARIWVRSLRQITDAMVEGVLGNLVAIVAEIFDVGIVWLRVGVAVAQRCRPPREVPCGWTPSTGPGISFLGRSSATSLPLWSMNTLSGSTSTSLPAFVDRLAETINVLLAAAIGDYREGRFARGRGRHADQIEMEIDLLDHLDRCIRRRRDIENVATDDFLVGAARSIGSAIVDRPAARRAAAERWQEPAAALTISLTESAAKYASTATSRKFNATMWRSVSLMSIY